MHLRPLPLLRHGACADETELARQLRPTEQRGAQLEVLREGDELRPLQQLHGQGGDCGGERACGLREVCVEDELREGRMALEEQPERRRAQLALTKAASSWSIHGSRWSLSSRWKAAACVPSSG